MSERPFSIKERISLASHQQRKAHSQSITPKSILVLGAGSFGTACACLFSRANPLNKVVIYDYKPKRVESINTLHKNPDYLTDIPLPDNLTATTDPENAFNVDVDFIFHSIPVQVSVEYLEKIKLHIDRIVKLKQESYNDRLATLKNKKEFITPSDDEKQNDEQYSSSATNPRDLQFIRPLVLICMSKGIHMQKLKCMHEVIDEILGLHQLHSIPPTPKNVSLTLRQLAKPAHVVDETITLAKLDQRAKEMDLMQLPSQESISSSIPSVLDKDTTNSLDLYRNDQNMSMSTLDDAASLFSPLPSLPTTPSNQNNRKNRSDDTSPQHPTNPLLIHSETPSFMYTCYLSGPSFALEIATNEPTGFTIASQSLPIATLVAQVISQDQTTVCTTTCDIWGVEISGALKNVYAIGAGLIDGLGFKWNTKALFITRASNEIRRIGFLLYRDLVDRGTFSTLAGIGDLLLSCLGPSRNRNVGVELAKGFTLEEIKRNAKELAEGVPTTHAVYTMLEQKGLVKYCPILRIIWQVLYENLPVEGAITYLLSLPVVEESL